MSRHIVTAREQVELLSPWLIQADTSGPIAPAQPSQPAQPAHGLYGPTGQYIHNPYNTGGMGPPAASGGGHSSGGGYSSGGGGGYTGGGSAGVSAPAGPGSVPLVQKSDGTWGSPNPAWDHLINRESGGRPSVGQGITDPNGGPGSPNAAQGLFQFTPATWAGAGGTKYGPNPGQATPQQQAEIAGDLIRKNPGGGDWGAGLPGREDAGALRSGLS